MKLRQASSELLLELESHRHRRYPDFVWAEQPEPVMGHVPVFVYHTIEPVEFEAHLQFLAANGYTTITAAELCEILSGGGAPPRDRVMLTIDDGRHSVWTYGFPLLKKYGMKATVFLVPGYVPESDRCTPNLDDVWSGGCAVRDIVARDPGLMSWTEIGAMHASGLVDFQVHTLFHHKVFVSDRLVDFHNPGNDVPLFDLPVAQGLEPHVASGSPDALWGMPIYEHESLMAGRPRYLSAADVTAACIARVAREGGRDFFRRRDWRQRLESVVREAPVKGRLQTPAELREELRTNLRTARQLIEARLPGQDAGHLCYPYGIGSDEAVAAARDVGYRSNYWLCLPDRSVNRPGDDPFHIVRLKGDYLLRLPGAGRTSLARVFTDKVVRRLSGRRVY